MPLNQGSWWLAGGASGPIFAFQPWGAADYTSSKTDLSTGGHNAADDTNFPTWTTGQGWTFNGTNQALQVASSLPNQKPVSFVARTRWIKNSVGSDLMGPLIGATNANAEHLCIDDTSGLIDLTKDGSGQAAVARSTNGLGQKIDTVIGVRYDGSGNYAFYLNGNAVGSGTNNISFTSIATTSYIGRDSGGFNWLAGQILAIAKYDNDIGDVAMKTVSGAIGNMGRIPPKSGLRPRPFAPGLAR